MADTLVNELIEAGVHFGHRASRWNPKMAPYIYARKNGIHIIDIRETIRGLLRAKKYLAQVAAQGSLVLFVGTKKQAGPVKQTISFATDLGENFGATLNAYATIVPPAVSPAATEPSAAAIQVEAGTASAAGSNAKNVAAQ